MGHKLVTTSQFKGESVSQSPGIVEIFEIPIQAATIEQALDRIDAAVSTRERLHIGVVNAAKIVNMGRDPDLAGSVSEADAIYADGMSVVWASRLLGRPLPERVAGIDLMNGILKRGNERAYRVFCLGARPDVLAKVCAEFRLLFPGIIIAGCHDGYFCESDEQMVAMKIRDSKPDILFVAITSPKKEKFMARWAECICVPVVHGVGGSFDVVAGLVSRAPVAWQNLGLEWLYRLIQEPGRLWRRYLVTNIRFSLLLMHEMIGSKSSRKHKSRKLQCPDSDS